MKTVRFLSDYTSVDEPNILTIHSDEQGDIHISMYEDNEDGCEKGVRIAISGTRYSPKVREAFLNLINVYENELLNKQCKSELQELNE